MRSKLRAKKVKFNLFNGKRANECEKLTNRHTKPLLLHPLHHPFVRPRPQLRYLSLSRLSYSHVFPFDSLDMLQQKKF